MRRPTAPTHTPPLPLAIAPRATSGPAAHLTSACSLAYWVACYPLDIIKSAIQTDSIYPEARRYRGGVIATGQQLWLEGGAKRFTAGLAPCLARSFPANAAGFAIYETTMKWLK